jgi:hypothetical protein
MSSKKSIRLGFVITSLFLFISVFGLIYAVLIAKQQRVKTAKSQLGLLVEKASLENKMEQSSLFLQLM